MLTAVPGSQLLRQCCRKQFDRERLAFASDRQSRGPAIPRPFTLHRRRSGLTSQPRPGLLSRPIEDAMSRNNYDGLPAAANFEQSIILAQLIILRDLERQGGDTRGGGGRGAAQRP